MTSDSMQNEDEEVKIEISIASSEDIRLIVENAIINLRQEVSLMHKKKEKTKKLYSFNVYSEIVDF